MYIEGLGFRMLRVEGLGCLGFRFFDNQIAQNFFESIP